jgi:hypothetical protein
MSEELRQACFELARITKWDRKPVDTAAIQALGDNFYKIAMDQESAPLNIDTALLTRAVRYLANAQAMPPMEEDTFWFFNMLRVVLEIARPNTGIEPGNKEFLKDMIHGIAESLSA